jgi:hypothetical protein
MKSHNAIPITAEPALFLSQLWHFDRSKLAFRSSLICLPAVAGPLLASFFTVHARTAVLLAAGAFSVGFGSFQHIRNRRILPMFGAAIGICISSWIGTFAGESPLASVIVTALAAALYGLVSYASSGVSWVSLQSLVWLVISTAYPARGNHIPIRGSLLFAGGMLQTVMIITAWKLGCTQCPPLGATQQETADPAAAVPELQWNLSSLLYGLRASITLALAMLFCHLAKFSNAYWIPMTVVIVLKPDRQQLFLRAIQRLLGTVLGAILATSIMVLKLHFQLPAQFLAALVLFFVWCGYSLIYANYGAFAICLTSYVIFLLAFAGLPERPLIVHRVLATIAGGFLVLASDALWALAARDRKSKNENSS